MIEGTKKPELLPRQIPRCPGDRQAAPTPSPAYRPPAYRQAGGPDRGRGRQASRERVIIGFNIYLYAVMMEDKVHCVIIT
jgi:hypothetical protein